jgi:SAM-dependent methyltransferase
MLPNSKFFEKRIGGSFHYQNYWMDLYADKIRESVFFKYVDVAGKKVLDFGCGDGSWGLKFVTRGARRVFGVEQTRKLATFCNHVCFYPDLRSIPNKIGAFDLITGFTSFQFTLPQNRHFILKDCHRLLKKGGELVIVDYLPDEVPSYQERLKYKHIWKLDSWRQLAFDSKFEITLVTPINWVDTTLFHYLGGNTLTFALTYALDKLFMFKPKYRLLVLTKK